MVPGIYAEGGDHGTRSLQDSIKKLKEAGERLLSQLESFAREYVVTEEWISEVNAVRQSFYSIGAVDNGDDVLVDEVEPVPIVGSTPSPCVDVTVDDGVCIGAETRVDNVVRTDNNSISTSALDVVALSCPGGRGVNVLGDNGRCVGQRTSVGPYQSIRHMSREAVVSLDSSFKELHKCSVMKTADEERHVELLASVSGQCCGVSSRGSEDVLQLLQCKQEPTGDRRVGQASPCHSTVNDGGEFIRNSLVEGVKEYSNDFCGDGTSVPEMEWPRQGFGHEQDELESSGWLDRTEACPVTCRLLTKESPPTSLNKGEDRVGVLHVEQLEEFHDCVCANDCNCDDFLMTCPIAEGASDDSRGCLDIQEHSSVDDGNVLVDELDLQAMNQDVQRDPRNVNLRGSGGPRSREGDLVLDIIACPLMDEWNLSRQWHQQEGVVVDIGRKVADKMVNRRQFHWYTAQRIPESVQDGDAVVDSSTRVICMGGNFSSGVKEDNQSSCVVDDQDSEDLNTIGRDQQDEGKQKQEEDKMNCKRHGHQRSNGEEAVSYSLVLTVNRTRDNKSLLSLSCGMERNLWSLLRGGDYRLWGQGDRRRNWRTGANNSYLQITKTSHLNLCHPRDWTQCGKWRWISGCGRSGHLKSDVARMCYCRSGILQEGEYACEEQLVLRNRVDEYEWRSADGVCYHAESSGNHGQHRDVARQATSDCAHVDRDSRVLWSMNNKMMDFSEINREQNWDELRSIYDVCQSTELSCSRDQLTDGMASAKVEKVSSATLACKKDDENATLSCTGNLRSVPQRNTQADKQYQWLLMDVLILIEREVDSAIYVYHDSRMRMRLSMKESDQLRNASSLKRREWDPGILTRITLLVYDLCSLLVAERKMDVARTMYGCGTRIWSELRSPTGACVKVNKDVPGILICESGGVRNFNLRIDLQRIIREQANVEYQKNVSITLRDNGEATEVYHKDLRICICWNTSRQLRNRNSFGVGGRSVQNTLLDMLQSVWPSAAVVDASRGWDPGIQIRLMLYLCLQMVTGIQIV